MVKIMKRIYKIFLIPILLLFLSSLISCATDNSGKVKIPDLTGKSRSEINEIMNDLGLKFFYRFEKKICYSEDEYDKFTRYDDGLKAGKYVSQDTIVYIFTTPLHLPGEDIVSVTMDFDYEGKTLAQDGIEKVTLARTVDGDTAHFYTQSGEYIKVRFLGINTPESTLNHDPWGLAASRFTKKILENAEEIVIELEGNEKDIYGRTLAFVWADGELVNLKLVLHAYSNAKISSDSKYYDAFIEADYKVSITGRGVYGEIDPDYDYQKGDFKYD